MSQILINDYLKQLDLIKRASGSQRETIVREAFKDLLKAWGRQQGLVFLAEYPLKTATQTNISVDGALLHELRMPLGYWEAKDAQDDLDAEVVKKFTKGYPQDNTIFSDDGADWHGTSQYAWVSSDNSLVKLVGKVDMHRPAVGKVKAAEVHTSDATVWTQDKRMASSAPNSRMSGRLAISCSTSAMLARLSST